MFKKDDIGTRNFSATLIFNDDNKLTAFHVFACNLVRQELHMEHHRVVSKSAFIGV